MADGLYRWQGHAPAPDAARIIQALEGNATAKASVDADNDGVVTEDELYDLVLAGLRASLSDGEAEEQFINDMPKLLARIEQAALHQSERQAGLSPS